MRYIYLPLVLAASCGASPQVREAYALEAARCAAAERAIVERESTAEQDELDLAIERARCDRALAEAGQ